MTLEVYKQCSLEEQREQKLNVSGFRKVPDLLTNVVQVR